MPSNAKTSKDKSSLAVNNWKVRLHDSLRAKLRQIEDHSPHVVSDVSSVVGSGLVSYSAGGLSAYGLQKLQSTFKQPLSVLRVTAIW